MHGASSLLALPVHCKESSAPVHQCTNAQFDRIISNKLSLGLYAECASALVHKCNNTAMRHKIYPRRRCTLHQGAGALVYRCISALCRRCNNMYTIQGAGVPVCQCNNAPVDGTTVH